MKTKEEILDEQHWIHLNYRQRITRKDWAALLFNDDDKVIFQGRVMRLKAKSLGAGIYEIYKAKLGG